MDRRVRFSKALVALAAVAFVAGTLPAQTGTTGIPTDWSHHHLVFSSPGTLQQAEQSGTVAKWLSVNTNPRYAFQQLTRYSASAAADSAGPLRTRLHRDWNVALGSGGTVGAGNYPAKYSLRFGASCGDYVVFNTGLPGSASQATVMALTNLYSGCPSVPTAAWAYNTATGDRVVTSVALSAAGDQIAFISTGNDSRAWLNVLRFESGQGSASGSPASPATSTSSGPVYAACKNSTGSCLLRLEFANGANDTTSSPFYDYTPGQDRLWAGDAKGCLHEFTGVFLGAPAEAGAPWPLKVTGDNTYELGSPVYDGSAYIFVGSVNGRGRLYSVTAAGVLNGVSRQLGDRPGIVDAPLVDGTAGTVYVSVSNDGSSNCAGGNACSVVVQFSTAFTSGSGESGTPVQVGVAATSNANIAMYSGAFDNAYFTSSSGAGPSGGLWVCGNTGGGSSGAGNPILYKIGIVANGMDTATAAATLTSGGAACSPVSEVFSNSHDYLFLSVTAGGDRTGCTGACVYNFDVTNSIPSNAIAGFASTGGSSAIAVDNSTVTGAIQGAEIYFTPLSTGYAILASQAPLN